MTEELREGMVLERNVGTTELASESPGAQIADRANLERNAAVGQQVQQRRIMNRCDSVAHTLDVQQLDGLPDFFRPADFAGMHEAMQTGRGRGLIHSPEILRSDA